MSGTGEGYYGSHYGGSYGYEEKSGGWGWGAYGAIFFVIWIIFFLIILSVLWCANPEFCQKKDGRGKCCGERDGYFTGGAAFFIAIVFLFIIIAAFCFCGWGGKQKTGNCRPGHYRTTQAHYS